MTNNQELKLMKGGECFEMKEKVDRAKELLRQLDRITDSSFAIKARKMLELQEALVETRKQLGISC